MKKKKKDKSVLLNFLFFLQRCNYIASYIRMSARAILLATRTKLRSH